MLSSSFIVSFFVFLSLCCFGSLCAKDSNFFYPANQGGFGGGGKNEKK